MIELVTKKNYRPVDKNIIATEILVVFVDHTECFLLKFLRRGFRHCFVLIRTGNMWIICDPLKNIFKISFLNLPENFNIKEFYVNQGHIVMCGKYVEQNRKKSFSVEILSCVNIAKRLLGVRSFWIWTPWQLFRFLNNSNRGWSIFRRSQVIKDRNNLTTIYNRNIF